MNIKPILILLICSTCLIFGDNKESQTPYQPKNFNHLIGQVPGLSDSLLKMHFKLYEGYVKQTNQLMQLIQEMDQSGNNRGPVYAGLKRMFGWEFDGMRLHEYYFENLGGNQPLSSNNPLYQKMVQNFGSYENWKSDFTATGLIRGIGWSILYIEPVHGKLINEWINEHDLGHLAGAKPLLVMDVFEHAYITEYGLDRQAYIDTFFKNINWEVVSKRYKDAISNSIQAP